jgi:tetratricopeptide (TPR) repeat protein
MGRTVGSIGEEANRSEDPPTARSRRARAWRDEVAAARAVCTDFVDGAADLEGLARIAPTLIDSVYSQECERVLVSVPDSGFDRFPRLALAMGRVCFWRGDRTEALAFLSRALSGAAGDRALLARATWELGCLALDDRSPSTAEVTLGLAIGALGRAAEHTPDVLHLEALLAEQHQDRALAIRKYREAIASANDALTLLTRTAALRNLAGTLAHDNPADAASLCALALALIDGDLLDERSRPSVENVLAYTLLAAAKLEDAKRRADAAVSDARRLGHSTVECHALFNQSIALELVGRPTDAKSLLSEALDVARDHGLTAMNGWIRLRLLWLDLKAGSPMASEDEIEESLAEIVGEAYSPSVQTFEAINAYRSGDPIRTIEILQPLVTRYTALSDWSTSLALLLWLACAHRKAGEEAHAAAAVEAALRIGRSHELRVSPNWWSDDLVRVARDLAGPRDAAYAKTLIAETGSVNDRIATRVSVSRDGKIFVDDKELPEEQWRTGRTGKGKLRRLFQCLVAAHPVGIEREELADMLWPESDGDRARQNLFAALNDLRRLIRAVPGLSIATEDGRYRLSAPAAVLFERARAPV